MGFFQKKNAQGERKIQKRHIVERRPNNKGGYEVKVDLNRMLTLDELIDVHKANIKTVKEQARLLGFTLE